MLLSVFLPHKTGIWYPAWGIPGAGILTTYLRKILAYSDPRSKKDKWKHICVDQVPLNLKDQNKYPKQMRNLRDW